MGKKRETYLADQIALLEARLAVLSRDNEALASENAALARDAADAARRAAAAEAALAPGAGRELAGRVASLESERAEVSGRVGELEAENARLSGRVEGLEKQNQALIEKIMMMNAQRWKPSSERAGALATGEVQLSLSLFNDVEAAAEGESADPADAGVDAAQADAADAGTEAEDKPKARSGRKRAPKSTPSVDDLEVTSVVDHRPDDLGCPACGAELRPMGYDTVKTVEYVPARLEVTEHRLWKYVCPECSEANQETGGEVRAQIVRADRPETPLPGTLASSSLLSHVLEQKYVWSMPVNRIWQQLSDMGLPACRQTLCNWVIAAWEAYLGPYEAEVWRRMRGRPVLQVDETTVQVLREPDRTPQQTSYMWVAATGEFDAGCRAVHLEYHPSRKYEVATKMLEGYRGHVVSDGYGAYDDLGDGITNSRCAMHMRRKFAAVVKTMGADAARAAGSLSIEVVERWAEVYRIEGSLKGMGPEARAGARRERVLPLLDSMLELLVERRPLCAPGALETAVDYSIKNLLRMVPYVEDGRVPLDNGEAERLIRPFAVGRRNWLFSASVRGAKASAGLYSVATTARMNGLHAGRFVRWLIDELVKGVPTTEEGWDRLMPWSKDVPASCRLKPGEPAGDADDPLVDVDPELLNPE